MPQQLTYMIVGLVTALSIAGPGYVSRYGAVLLFLLALPELARGAKLRKADWLAVSLASWALASQFWARDPQLAMDSWKDLAGGVAIFISLRILINTASGFRVVLIAYLAGCLGAVYQLARGEGGASFALSESATRATLDGVNANHLAYALTMGVIFVPLLWVIKRPALVGRLTVYVLVAAVYLLGITQTGTRGALAALAAFAIWLLLWKLRVVRSVYPAVLAFVVVQVVIVLGTLDERVRPSLSVSARETGTLNGRLEIWPVARSVFDQHLFAGVGLDGFIGINEGTAAHNVALDLGTGLGAIGILLFLAWIYQALIVNTRSVDSGPRTLVVGGAVMALTPILASGYWHQSPTFWAAVSLLSLLPLMDRASRQWGLHERGEPSVPPPPSATPAAR